MDRYNETLIFEIAQENPQNLMQVIALLKERYQIETKPEILKRYFKKGPGNHYTKNVMKYCLDFFKRKSRHPVMRPVFILILSV